MTERQDWNRQIIEEFRANDGKVGGRFEGAPLLLLHTVGAKSGEPRVNPVVYQADGDKLVVFASFAGQPKNPAWFHNLMAGGPASVEVGTDTFPAEYPLVSHTRADVQAHSRQLIRDAA